MTLSTSGGLSYGDVRNFLGFTGPFSASSINARIVGNTLGSEVSLGELDGYGFELTNKEVVRTVFTGDVAARITFRTDGNITLSGPTSFDLDIVIEEEWCKLTSLPNVGNAFQISRGSYVGEEPSGPGQDTWVSLGNDVSWSVSSPGVGQTATSTFIVNIRSQFIPLQVVAGATITLTSTIQELR